MHKYGSLKLGSGRATPMPRFRNAGGPSLMGGDPRLPRVGELVALHCWQGPRLWVGRVRSAYDKAASVAFDPVASEPAEPHMPEPGEPVELSGLAGSPVDASGTVRGHNGTVVLLRDVTAGGERAERSRISVGTHGRLWCDDGAGTSCWVEVLDRFPDGLCIGAPAWVHPGDEVVLASPVGAAGAVVRALVVACREGRHGRAFAHVAFVAGPSDAHLRDLLAGLSDHS